MKNCVPFDKDFCLQKLEAVIELAEKLVEGDYPQRDSRLAISKILSVYVKERDALKLLETSAQQDTILEYCRRANINLERFKHFLGMLLRSANIRNAFEQYFPIKILASELIGEKTCLVFSSEWMFSPFTYPVPLPELPEFVFIGIPASECQNPLIMPLAGHELGHVIWSRKGAKQEFDSQIKETILQKYKENWDDFTKLFGHHEKSNLETDLFLLSIWVTSIKFCQRQIEEVFCDFVGFYVFGASFCYSFRYLLAPGFKRSPYYPSIRDRAQFLVDIAKRYNVSGFETYPDAFNEEEIAVSPSDQFILRMADAATRELVELLPNLVEKYCAKAEKFDTGSTEENQIETCLRNLVPAASVRSMAAVVNAAWNIRLSLDQWEILNNIDDCEERRKEKLRILSDLVLKSFEVFEYRKRLERHAP